MRVVLDTNTVVSALFWSGSPRRLLDLVYSGRITAFTSDELILELEDVLRRAKFVSRLASEGTTARTASLQYAALATLIQPPKFVAPICEDPDDDAVLECALSAAAEAIVSGDRHLLKLGSFRGIEIMPAGELLRRLDNPP
jgi:putative PIN family toxin of toxin-antitoxin system